MERTELNPIEAAPYTAPEHVLQDRVNGRPPPFPEPAPEPKARKPRKHVKAKRRR